MNMAKGIAKPCSSVLTSGISAGTNDFTSSYASMAVGLRSSPLKMAMCSAGGDHKYGFCSYSSIVSVACDDNCTEKAKSSLEQQSTSKLSEVYHTKSALVQM